MGNQILAQEEEENYVFTKDELRVLYDNFVELDKDGSGLIEVEEFLNFPELKNNPIVKRVISIFDMNQDGKISFYEFIVGLSALTDISFNRMDKLNFAFKIYDNDGDGFISNGDLFKTLKLLTGKSMNDLQIQQIVDRTIIGVDKDFDGKISFEEFVDCVQDMRVYELFSMNLFL